MKNAKRISAVLASILLIVISTVTTLAAGLTVNGTSAQVGDTVNYTLNLADVPSPVAGIQISVFYDSEYLEVDPDTITCNGFPGALVNATTTLGEIVMNASNGVEGYDFKTKNQIISINFNVIKEGNTDITYFISDLFDIYEYGPGDYLKTYTLTSNISVNNASVSEDVPPILNHDKAENENSGDFQNNESGIGEVKPEDATPPNTDTSAETPSSDPNSSLSGNSDDTNNSDASSDNTDNKNENPPVTTIVVVIVAILVVAAVVAITIFMKKSSNKSDGNSKETNKDNKTKK